MVQESDFFDIFEMSQRELLEFARNNTEFCVDDMLDALGVAGGLEDLTEHEHRHRELLVEFLRATRANAYLQLFMETSNSDTFTLDELVTWAIEEETALLEDDEVESDPELRRSYAASLAEDVEYLLEQKSIRKEGENRYRIAKDYEVMYH